MLKKIFLKILWNRRKDYLLVILSGIFVVSIVFFSASVGTCLHYVKTGGRKELQTTTVFGDVEQAYLLPYVLLLFLMILTLISYIQKRSRDYAMLTVLGIQKKHRYLFVGAEYLGIVACSIGGGLLLGFAEGMVVKNILEKVFADVTDRILLGDSPLRITLIVSVLLFGLGFIICDQMIACLGIDALTARGKKSGRAIKNAPLFIVFGIIVVGISFVLAATYWGQIGSIVPQVFAAVGLIVLMVFGISKFLYDLKKHKGKYYPRLLWMDDWYHRFYHHVNITFIVAVFLLIILYSFVISLLDDLPVTQKENYPHDLVWMANSGDEAFLESLKEKYHVQAETRPCIRVATADFGEHVGVSASEYEKWTGKKVRLKDKEIHVVYQRDREELGTVGIDFSSKKPRMFIGNSEDDLWVFWGIRIQPGNKLVRDYGIKSTEERILTGNFKTRSLKMACDVFEDIIVFSDREFERIRGGARGANLQVVMEIPESRDEVLEEVYAYAAEHSQVNYYDWQGGNLIYDGRQLGIESRQQKTLDATAMLINIITLLLCLLFTLVQKIKGDYEDMEWKYQFYYRSGMTKRKRKRYVYKEVFMTAKLALCCGLPLSVLLMAEKVWGKHLPAKWNMRYLAEMGGIVLAVAAVICLVIRIAAWDTFSGIERKNRDARKGS